MTYVASCEAQPVVTLDERIVFGLERGGWSIGQMDSRKSGAYPF